MKRITLISTSIISIFCACLTGCVIESNSSEVAELQERIAELEGDSAAVSTTARAITTTTESELSDEETEAVTEDLRDAFFVTPNRDSDQRVLEDGIFDITSYWRNGYTTRDAPIVLPCADPGSVESGWNSWTTTGGFFPPLAEESAVFSPVVAPTQSEKMSVATYANSDTASAVYEAIESHMNGCDGNSHAAFTHCDWRVNRITNSFSYVPIVFVDAYGKVVETAPESIDQEIWDESASVQALITEINDFSAADTRVIAWQATVCEYDMNEASMIGIHDAFVLIQRGRMLTQASITNIASPQKIRDREFFPAFEDAFALAQAQDFRMLSQFIEAVASDTY